MPLQALWDVPAPAKLNLFLHIVGRRADGYHLLQSPFVLIDWADKLHFERRSDGRLHRHDVGAALPPEDLCLRAARALQAATGCALGADIHIDKRVPSGAGMGGGSSDAATTLLALNRLWGLRLPRARLAGIGLASGADVPFFIGGQNAFVEGIGEQLTPIDLPTAAYAVIWPGETLTTEAIFKHPALLSRTGFAGLLNPLGGRPASAGPGIAGLDSRPAIVTGFPQGDPSSTIWAPAHGDFGSNELQHPAEDRCPAVASAARWLAARFGNSRMTGSGSAVFARVEEQDYGFREGRSALAGASLQAGNLPPGWVGRMCSSLLEHPLRGWAG